MSTKEPDYHAFMRETSPDPNKRSDQTQRHQRQQASLKTKISIRIDADILDEFKHLAGDEAAKQSLKEILREELLPLNKENTPS